MLATAHRQAAEDIELGVQQLQGNPQVARLVIEGAWGASFHWIAYGCQTKHQKHQESHARLGSFLRHQNEHSAADWWDSLERIRQGGWYGKGTDPTAVQEALDFLDKVRNWAMS